MPATSESIIGVSEDASRGPIEIAPGCFVTYDLEAIDILKALAQKAAGKLGAFKLFFVRASEGLTPEQTRAFERHEKFFDELESTLMTKSYKMLVLQALLNEDRFPGEIPADALGEAVRTIASRTRRLRDELGP